MDKASKYQMLAMRMVKALLAAYVVTGGLLLLLAVLLHRFHLSRGQVSVGIIVIYIAASFISGFLSGKMMKTRKFIWGMLSGMLYFLALTIISLAVNRTFSDGSSNFVTTLVLCMAGGTLGGMIS